MQIGNGTFLHGDCLEVMKGIPDGSIDSIVTDPPYGLSSEPDMVEVLQHWLAGDDYIHKGSGFMGKSWDSFVPGPTIWREALRVLKPGGHMVAFFGTRTYDMGTLAIRLAGFEIRDQLAWVYGSGFPKSMDVSKAIDKAAGAEREVIGRGINYEAKVRHAALHSESKGNTYMPAPTDPVITAPATPEAQQWEGWGTALKPAWEPIVLARKPLIGTVAANVLEHGTGAINIDGCRVEGEDNPVKWESPRGGIWTTDSEATAQLTVSDKGRFPANILHDGEQFGENGRYFYSPKASKKDRGEGNTHPTVKPTELMAYLCRLITPPGGTVLDPFMGSGSTGKAAHSEGFQFVGIERDEDYYSIALARLWEQLAA